MYWEWDGALSFSLFDTPLLLSDNSQLLTDLSEGCNIVQEGYYEK